MSPNGHLSRQRLVIMRMGGAGKRHTGDFADLEAEFPDLQNVLGTYGATAERLIQVLEAAEIAGLEDEAARTWLPPVRSLLSYWLVRLAADGPSLALFLDDLRGAGGVEAAYVDGSTIPGAVTYETNDPLLNEQTYLGPRPQGVNARWAWDRGCLAGKVATNTGGEGRGLRVADVEHDWNENHKDLAPKAQHVHGERLSDEDDISHGTAVLGLLFATHDNEFGIAGLGPEVEKVFLLSPRLPGGDSNNAEALTTAAFKYLQPGDVLLIELEYSDHTPLETFAHNFDAIRLASALGRTVVELAGNGENQDLSTVSYFGTSSSGPSGTMILDPGGPEDSGAIIVGSCEMEDYTGDSGTGHKRRVKSNFGDRVDCFAFGTQVRSLDAQSPNDLTGLREDFNGTSSASAIIAGSVLLLQQMWAKAHNDQRLGPAQIRWLLRQPGPDPAAVAFIEDTPTPVYGLTDDEMETKYVPNLAYCSGLLQVTTDLHVRDNLADDGSVPSDGIASRSPDIIVRQSSQDVFGEGSGTEGNDDLGSTAVAATKNWVYVRARNLGAPPAVAATARVWWSEPATLVTPQDWHEIGAGEFPVIPGGGAHLAVTEPIEWNDVPVSGHYCFVAVLDAPSDPAPPLPANADWSQFLEFIRANNSVAWRNFDVIDAPGAGTAWSTAFLVRGAPDRRRRFAIRLTQNLPIGAKVELEVPLPLAWRMRGSPLIDRWTQTDPDTVVLGIARLPNALLMSAGLPANAVFRVQLKITNQSAEADFPSAPASRRTPELSIQQLFAGRPVGQLTFAFRGWPESRE